MITSSKAVKRVKYKILKLMIRRSIQDLNYWESCSRVELEHLREFVKENNFELDVGERLEERETQKHLDDLSEDIVNFLRGVNE